MTRKIAFLALILLAVVQPASAADYILVTVLHTNDMHAAIAPEDAPGLAKLTTLVREIQADMPNVILLDAGDIIHGSFEDYLSGGKAAVSAMNAAGYMAATTGNHEYDFGLPVLRGAMEIASFPMLAANIKDKITGESWDRLQPYVVFIVSGVRIGVLGLGTLDTIKLQWPGSIADIRIDDPIKTAKTLVPAIREEVDVLVVLSHLGYNQDQRLAREVAGIDFILGGHSHTTLDKWEWIGDTLVAQAGAYARYLGRIDFIVALDDAGGRIASVNGRDGRLWNDLTNRPLGKFYPTSPLLPVSKSLPDDPAVSEAYRPYREQAQAVLDEIIGEASDLISILPSKSGETPAANLAADAIRAYGRADIGVVDAWSVEKGLDKGQVRLKDAYQMIGGYTRQQIVVVKIKGKDILSILRAKLLKNGSLKLQVSGITLAYRIGKNDAIELRDVMIGSSPIEQGREYTLAGQAYIIQEFMQAGQSAQVIAEPNATTREAIAGFIRSVGKINAVTTDRIKYIIDKK